MVNDLHSNSAIFIQKSWRKCISYRKNIQNEINFFRRILKNIMFKINDSYKNYIIKLQDYKKSMNDIQKVIQKIDFFPKHITIRFLKKYTNYKILIQLAQIKIKIIDLTNTNGSNDINELIELYFDTYKNDNDITSEYKEHIKFYGSFYRSIKCELYESDDDGNNILFKLNTYGKKKKTASITLASYQIDLPTVNKYNCFTKNLLLKTMGAKLFIPYKSKLLILYGYFINDDMNQYKNEAIFESKYNTLSKLFINLDIDDNFKHNFIESLPITDFLLNTPSAIASKCISYHTDMIKFKNKNISKIVKEFLINDIDKQKYILTLLLLDTADNDSGYLAHLLYDILDSDISKVHPKNSIIIYDILHWHLKKLFSICDELALQVNNKINDFNDDCIPYEKRIHLMKASDYVKSKAIDKLKEINNSKNGESNAKAQQYLDGLLKIPFGIYKKECIRYKLDDVINKYNKIISIIRIELNEVEETHSLNDIDLQKTAQLNEIINTYDTSIKNPIQLSQLNTSIQAWIKDILSQTMGLDIIYDIDKLQTDLCQMKVKDLKSIVHKYGITTTGMKKNNIITTFLNNKFSNEEILSLKKHIDLKKIYFQLSESEQFITIIASLEQMNNIWTKYLDAQSKYFKDISKILDNKVYGLTDAKNQIKRLLAQWINGNDQGYVFGFEGPPGTGKTTLAKCGIAECLRDEFDNSRPFIFIALGGSSNGSTLEGHNYTYVGSTWGRIIDGIIDAKSMNPIIYIDELDKISRTEHGKEIIGILTHLTDPSQNAEFTDKYFSGIKFDISKCLIIFSYNDPSLIDKVLLDRIQRIRIDPLNKVDKLMVAKKHIIPEILKNIGYNETDIIIDDNELIHIIDSYTYEAGARKFKEKLYEIYREINLNYLIGGNNIIPFTITKSFIDKVFENYPKTEINKIHKSPRVGLVNGLFATATGIGGITVIEAFKYPSSTHLELKLTGMQGDVMKESMAVAKTLTLNMIPKNVLSNIQNVADSDKFGIHIHCPEGATPKDGPSAGTAITVAMISLLCNIPVLNTIALTGEINLNGNVMPIGGLESKVDGGKVAGVTHILCPDKNDIDLKKIRKRVNPPEDKSFKIEKITNIYEALDRCLLLPTGETSKTFFAPK